MSDKLPAAEKNLPAGICGILLGWLGIDKFNLGWWVLSKALLEKRLRWLCIIQSLGLRRLSAPALAGLAGLLVAVWAWWLIGRQVAAVGYAERADDLLVTRGIMFRELVVVPFGRMQLVDVRAGPLDRRFGIARLQLHTAAATTDASVPGLPTAEAQRLRDHLAALGEARSAGL